MADKPQRPGVGSDNVDALIGRESDPHNGSLQTLEINDFRLNSPNQPRHDFLASGMNTFSPSILDINNVHEAHVGAHASRNSSASSTPMTMAAPMNKMESLRKMVIQNQQMLQNLIAKSSGISWAPSTMSAAPTDDSGRTVHSMSDSEKDRVASDHDINDNYIQTPVGSMDDFINKCIRNDNNDDNEPLDNEHVQILESLKEFFGDEDKCGLPINDSLAEILSAAFHTRVTEEKTKKIADLYHKPSNMKNCHVPITKDSVWGSLRRKTQDMDAKLQKIQMQQIKSIIPTVQVFDKLLAAGKAGKGLNAKETSECFKLLQHSIQLSQTAFNEISYRRRHFLKGDLKPCYRQLCYDNNPITKYLLGDNVQSKMKDIDTAQKVGNKVGSGPSGNRKSFSGHGHGNRRPFHPYNQGRQGQGKWDRSHKQHRNNFLGKKKRDNIDM